MKDYTKIIYFYKFNKELFYTEYILLYDKNGDK